MKPLKLKDSTIEKLRQISNEGETLDDVVDRLIPVPEQKTVVKLSKKSVDVINIEKAEHESLDEAVNRIIISIPHANPIELTKVLSPDMMQRFKTFSFPDESCDETFGRLLLMAATNSISDGMKTQLVKIGWTGDSLDDVVFRLYDHYMNTTRNTTIHTFIKEKISWDKYRSNREAREYLGHRYDRGKDSIVGDDEQ